MVYHFHDIVKQQTQIMKKLLTGFAILTAFLISTTVLKAQDTSWGPMAGVNGSTLMDMPLNIYKPGVNLGVFLNHSNREHTGIKVEATYTQMGTNFMVSMTK